MGGTMSDKEVEYVVTFLEMTRRPTAPPPPLPAGPKIALMAAKRPPPDYFLYLYGTVGADYEWTDWFAAPRPVLEAFVHDPKIELFTMMLDGWPGGFFIVDTRVAGVCDLSYFGLVREAIGRGLGTWLVATAVRTGWDRPGVERLTVNTCTLDHPRALVLYQKAGFVAVHRETRRRALTGRRPRRG